jgi:hypothetical protein
MKPSEIKKLLLQYNDILKKLRNADVIRTSKLVGEYGEYVTVNKLCLDLVKSGNKGYDAIDTKGKKYEIKSRKEMPYNKPNNFPIREKQLESADFLIGVYFDVDWNLSKLYKIPKSKVIIKNNKVIINKALEKYNIL